MFRRFFSEGLWRIKTKRKEVWLTFDDGPDPETTPWILSILKDLNINATFFLIGEDVQKHPKLLEKILNNNHVIGNHSYSHKNGWKVNVKRYINDVRECNKLLGSNLLFRPPYGKITFSQMKKLKRHYKIIFWDILSYDFKANISPKKIKSNVLNNISPGSIIVFHNNKKSLQNLKKILRETLEEIQKKGYGFSTTW